ncbi:unnamed protein product [Arabidopsis halleri]
MGDKVGSSEAALHMFINAYKNALRLLLPLNTFYPRREGQGILKGSKQVCCRRSSSICECMCSGH